MKKLAMTLAIILGMCMGGFAQNDACYADEYEGQGGGLFGLGSKMFDRGGAKGDEFFLPNEHGLDEDVEADDAPLGSGAIILFGLGAAYLVAKKRKED